MKQWAEREGVTEKRKSDHPMERGGRMNVLCEAVTETVNAETIFAGEGESVAFPSQQRNGGISSTLCLPTVLN